MSEQPNHFELIAYIDGVLPSDRREAVENAIAANRELRRQLRQLVKLRSCSRQVMRQNTPEVSTQLRSRIQLLMQAPESRVATVVARIQPVRKPGWFKPSFRMAMAAGIVLCVVGGIWFGFLQERTLIQSPARQVVQGAKRAGLPAQLVTIAQARHLNCVMMGNNFAYPEFPRVLAESGPAVRAFLGDAVEIPDLTSIGLEFAGVGPCQINGAGKALHWLFRSTNNSKINVSVFVQPFEDQVTFARNTACVVAGPTEAFPMLVWRSDKHVYYLIGDDFGATSETAKQFGVGFGL